MSLETKATAQQRPVPTGREVSFDESELIVSKTNLKGVITYANDVFVRVSGYTEAELLGQPHNILRHPAMPRCIFQLLWSTIQSGQEIFAYVLNMAKSGDGYWVFAHVTPSYDASGRHIGYHSNRRVPYPEALDKVRPLYASLLTEESRHSSPKEAMSASSGMIAKLLADRHITYGEFVFSLCEQTKLERSLR